jgi:hypothetical protein
MEKDLLELLCRAIGELKDTVRCFERDDVDERREGDGVLVRLSRKKIARYRLLIEKANGMRIT